MWATVVTGESGYVLFSLSNIIETSSFESCENALRKRVGHIAQFLIMSLNKLDESQKIKLKYRDFKSGQFILKTYP